MSTDAAGGPPREERTTSRAYGRVFSSVVELHGFELVDAPADVVVSFGDVPAMVEQPTASGMFWTANADEVVMTTPGIVGYHIHRATGITVEAYSEIGRTDAFIHGTPIAASLMHLGHTVLHGAAADVDGGAVVFVGANGAGKSSLAAALSADGGRPLCDNLAVLDVTDERVEVHTGPASIRLWEDMAEELGVDIVNAPRVRDDMNKYVVRQRRPLGPPARVRAIVTVEPAPIDRPVIERLDAMAATAAVMSNHFRGKLARAVSPSAMSTAAHIARVVPVHALRRPIAGVGPVELADFVRAAVQ